MSGITYMTDKKTLASAKKAAKILHDFKGEDIVLIDVRKTSGVTDYYLIVTGNSAPHLKALLREVQYIMKHEETIACRTAGMPDSGWVVLDCASIVVHIFSRTSREYYAVEELWAGNPRVKLQLPPLQ